MRGVRPIGPTSNDRDAGDKSDILELLENSSFPEVESPRFDPQKETKACAG
jgi:hypothetical protein